MMMMMMMMMMSCVGAAFFKEKKKEKKVEINPHTSQKENFFVGSIIFLHLCKEKQPMSRD